MPEQFKEYLFPVAGIDVQEEFEEQPDLTTPVAVNVRAYEPSSDRARGGSRPGISRYLPQLPSGSNVIQHLKVVVDPQAPLTGLSFNDGDTVIDDTSDGGRAVLDDGSTRQIRVGGSGFYTHPENVQEPIAGDTQIQLIQNKASYLGAVASGSLSFADNVGDNLVLVVVAQVGSLSATGTVAVTNDAGAAYTQAGSYADSDGTFGTRLSFWWKYTTADLVADKTVNVALFGGGAGEGMTVYAMEFKNVRRDSPLASSNPIGDTVFDSLDVPADGTNPLPGPFTETIDYATKDAVIYVAKSTGDGVGYTLSGFMGSYSATNFNPGGTFQSSPRWSNNATPTSESFTLTHGTPLGGAFADKRSGFVFGAVTLKWSGA